MPVLGEQRVELIDAAGKRHEAALLQIKGTAIDSMVKDAAQRRIVLTVDAPSVAGGDAVTVNGASLVDADLDDTTPAAPAGGENVLWQKDASSPANISAYVREATALLRGILQLAGQLGGSAAAPDVRGLRETGTPTLLALGAVADGEFLKRVGATVVGAAGGGGDNVSVNGVAAVDADFDNITPAAPVGGLNVRWQKDALTPNNISGNIGFDENGNEILTFLTNVSAVNNLRVQNKPTLNDPVLESLGDDANVGIQLSTKGTRYAYINNDGEILTQGRGQIMTSGAKKTFVHGATDSGFRLGPNSGNPTAPVDGDLWNESVTGKIRYQEGGTIYQLRNPITKALSADQSNSTTTLTKVTGLDQVAGVGTWAFKYLIRHQAAALTTGVRFSVNHSGTVTSFVWLTRFVDVSAAASTAAQDQDAILATGSVVGAFASRAKSTLSRGTTLSVDTINADMLTIIEGLMVVTASGNIELWHGSEVAAATTVKQDSALILTKIG